MICRTAIRSALAFIVTLLLSATAQAQLFRAYLAPGGSDVNPCTLQQPCRLLPAALTAVANGGEIWMLDSANYNTGPVNITKSVTILAVPGALGSVVATGGGNAIDIATAGVEVALRNLVIVPVPGGGGTGGVNMTAGDSLTVENCLIANVAGPGIAVSASARVAVTDSTIRDGGANGLLFENGPRATVTRAVVSGNLTGGIHVAGSAAATTTTADIADSTVSANFGTGVSVMTTNATAVLKVSLRDSRVVGNANHGAAAQSAGASVSLSASGNIVSNNGFSGMASFNAGAKVWASGNTVSDNAARGFYNIGGLFESAQNNAVRNNNPNITGTITVVAME